MLCVPSLEPTDSVELPAWILLCSGLHSPALSAGRMDQDPDWVSSAGSPTMGTPGIVREQKTDQGREHCVLVVFTVRLQLPTAPAEGSLLGCAAGTLRGWSFSIFPNQHAVKKRRMKKGTRSNSLLLSSHFLTLILPAHKPRATE